MTRLEDLCGARREGARHQPGDFNPAQQGLLTPSRVFGAPSIQIGRLLEAFEAERRLDDTVCVPTLSKLTVKAVRSSPYVLAPLCSLGHEGCCGPLILALSLRK